MVEDVLRSEAPKEESARRVYEAIVSPLSWAARNEAISSIGPRGIEGWLRAMESPDWTHRRWAMQMQRHLHSPENIETILESLKRALKDPNKKIRRSACDAVLALEVDDARMRRELVPLVVPMLADPSRLVRRMAAFYLLRFADLVPLELAVDATSREPERTKRWQLVELVKRIAASQS